MFIINFMITERISYVNNNVVTVTIVNNNVVTVTIVFPVLL